jgi:hypothetical protein
MNHLFFMMILSLTTFLSHQTTWTEIPFYSWSPWAVNATVCPGDVDMYNHRNLAYGGWVHATIVRP